MLKRFLIFLGLIKLLNCCSDFVFIIDTEVDDSPLGRSLQRRRELALKTAQQLDLSSGLHRAALILYGKRTLDELLVSSFEDNQETDSFVNILKKEFDSLLVKNETRKLLPSVGTAEAVDVLLKKVLRKKRMGSSVVVLVFTDGRVRPGESDKLQKVTSQLSKKYYIHTFVVNPESSISIERNATLELLTNGEKKSIITSKNRQTSAEQKLNKILHPFISCKKSTKSRILRRKQNSLPKSTVSPSKFPYSTVNQNSLFKPTVSPSKLPYSTVKQNSLPKPTVSPSKLPYSTVNQNSPPKPTVSPSKLPYSTVKQNSLPKPTVSPSKFPYSTVNQTCLQDIIFLVDNSDGTVEKNQKYLFLISNIIKNLQLSPLSSQIAFIKYSGPKRTTTVFHLKKHSNSTSAISEISNSFFLGGTTRTGEAMLEASKEYNKKYGSRKNAKKIMIIFTDGYSQDNPTNISIQLRNQKIQIYVVAVNDPLLPPNLDQLKSIATDPKFVILEKDFPKLKQQLTQPHC